MYVAGRSGADANKEDGCTDFRFSCWPPRSSCAVHAARRRSRLRHSVMKPRRNGIVLATPWFGSISERDVTISKDRGATHRVMPGALCAGMKRAGAVIGVRC
jgi:hypothetical protein